MTRRRIQSVCGAILSLASAGSAGWNGCDNLYQQARYDPFEPSTLFADRTSARPLMSGTVARGHAETDDHLYAGLENGQPATTFPFPITERDLVRGRERFTIFCSPCHGATGDGDGMIVQRGFTPPPSYHIERLRDAPIGHFFQVMSNGWGAMYSYRERVPVEDRWRIAAWIRVLQLSRNTPLGSLDPGEQRRLGGQPQ